MDFTNIIKTVAPWIGTALGGPLGGLAVEAATSALGLSDKTSQGLQNALAGVSQADLLALKKADQEFQATMQAMNYKNLSDLENIEASDRKSARDMQIATRSNIPALLTSVLTVGMTSIIALLICKGIPDSAVVQLLLGSYTTAWLTSVTYWFGSTDQSKTKTEIIANSQPLNATK